VKVVWCRIYVYMAQSFVTDTGTVSALSYCIHNYSDVYFLKCEKDINYITLTDECKLKAVHKHLLKQHGSKVMLE